MRGTARLEVGDLGVSVAGRPLLHGVALQVQPGRRVALLGASSSGKSLTVLALLGLLGPSSTSGVPCGWPAVSCPGAGRRVVEAGPVQQVVASPQAPFTAALVEAARTGLRPAPAP